MAASMSSSSRICWLSAALASSCVRSMAPHEEEAAEVALPPPHRSLDIDGRLNVEQLAHLLAVSGAGIVLCEVDGAARGGGCRGRAPAATSIAGYRWPPQCRAARASAGCQRRWHRPV